MTFLRVYTILAVEVLNLMLTMLDINKKSLPEGDFRVVPWLESSTRLVQRGPTMWWLPFGFLRDVVKTGVIMWSNGTSRLFLVLGKS